MKDNFKGVGVFHFGSENKENPVESLKVELRKLDSDVSGWLIVLPEGFNVVRGYPKGTPDRSINKILLKISECRQIAFVVGLIEIPEKNKKFNLSYLLDGFEVQRVLSWKHDPKSPEDEDRNSVFCATPIVHRGLAISAPICNDFSGCSSDNQTAVVKCLRALSPALPFLCVPACSTQGHLNIASADWTEKGISVATANGDKRDTSYIRRPDLPRCELASYNEHSGHSHADNKVLLSRIDSPR